jgi:hypothetical protein
LVFGFVAVFIAEVVREVLAKDFRVRDNVCDDE